MNKRQAKREAYWITYQEIEDFLSVGGHLEFEEPDKIEAAMRELQDEMLRRSGKLEKK